MKIRFLLLGIMLVSTAVLSLETFLPRIFAVYVGPNFVFFCISIALVGLSSGGIIVYVWQDKLLLKPKSKLANLALLTSISIYLGCWLLYLAGTLLNNTIDTTYATILAQDNPNPGYILSSSIVVPSMLFVGITGLIMAVPFMFAGMCLSLTYRLVSKEIGKIYAFDLIGAGLGCALTVVALTWLSAANAISLICIIGSFGALLYSMMEINHNRRPLYLSLSAIILFSVVFLVSVFIKSPFEYKVHKYAYLRSFDNTPLEELDHRWTPLGRIALCSREWTPPLNKSFDRRPLNFVGMDLGGFSVVEKFTPGNLEKIKSTSVFSDDIMEPVVVPGMYRDLVDYLVLMAGNGQDMMRAYASYGDSIDIEGVELNPAVYELGFQIPGSNLENFFGKPNIQMHIDEGRAFVEKSDNLFDVICLSYSGATFATGTGALASTPQFLFTKEAFLTYLKKLRPGGVIIVIETSLPEELPGSLKTFQASLKQFKPDSDIRKHIISYTRPGFVDSRQYTIYHRDPLTKKQVIDIQKVFDAKNLVITYSAYTTPDYPKLEEFFASGSSGEKVLNFSYMSYDRIHSDNHPFFYFNLIWGTVGGFLVIGYLATFLSAIAISALFFSVPLFLKKTDTLNQKRPPWFYYMAFAILGVGFMLIEVGSIQRFELFLGNPTLSLIVILAVLLIWTGMGSYYSTRLFDLKFFSITKVSFLIVLYGVFVLFFLNDLIYGLMGLHLFIKIGIITLVLLPLGFLLGNLFPQLLRQLEVNYKQFIPWALAINGVFSVASSNLGAIIYLFLGANMVVISGLGCYAVLLITSWIREKDLA